MRQLAQALPARPTRRCAAEVLPFWQSPRGPQRLLIDGARDPAGDHAAAAARRLRQHREPRAGARQRAAARDGRAPGARRRARGASSACCSPRTSCSALAGRGAGRGDRRLGHAGAASRCRSSGLPDPVPDERRRRRVSRSRCSLGVACGLVFGAAPALQLARVDPQLALRAGVADARAAAACATR